MTLNIALICAVAGAPPPLGTFTSEKGGFRLSWSLVGDAADHAEFELSLNGSAYAAIGFGGSMFDADIVIGWVGDDGKAHVGDYWSKQHGVPSLDTALGGTNDVTPLGGSRIGSRTTVRFRRKLVTGDQRFDRPLSVAGQGAITNVVYAWTDGTPGALVFHADRHNHVQIDLSAPDGVARNSTFGPEEVGGGARQLVAAARQGTLVTIQSEPLAGGRAILAGWPYGSVADYADDGRGRPLLLLSQLERNIINLGSDPRCSLAIHTPTEWANFTDADAEPRTTLFGHLRALTPAEIAPARAIYLARHPLAKGWIDFEDFALWRMEVLDVYWVGGFGNDHYIGYVGADAYLAWRAA